MGNYKEILIVSHSLSPEKILRLSNGDSYDSEIIVKDKNDKEIFYTNRVNVDSSNNLSKNYKIEIETGTYGGFVWYHMNKYKAIWLFDISYFDLINNINQMTLEARTLKCKTINPKHNKKIVIGVNIHKGGDLWDWSEGCITIYNKEFDNFINNFEINEKVIIYKE